MRHIDADQMLEDFKELHGEENYLLNCYSADWIESFIEDYPTADVREVRHGKWEKANSYAVWDKLFEYCPHCGAKMDGVT